MQDLGTEKLTKEQLAELTAEERREYRFVRRKTIRQAIKYFFCAASAGVIQIVSFAIMQNVFEDVSWGTMTFIIPMEVSMFVATTVALALSVFWNFNLNRKFTFKDAGNVPKAMALAFLFYVPFYPFQTWYVPTIKTALGNTELAGILAEGTVMLINCVLEFCWQKFVVFRKNTKDASVEMVGKIGPNGEITPLKDRFTGDEMYALLHDGVDVNAVDDKTLKAELIRIERQKG